MKKWGREHLFCFCGYAAWNYVMLPLMLYKFGDRIVSVGDSSLSLSFPKQFITHSREQSFRLDPDTGRLLEHRYTAEVFGNWARAVNVAVEETALGALRFISTRRVYPQMLYALDLRWATLVNIHLSAFEVLRRGSTG